MAKSIQWSKRKAPMAAGMLSNGRIQSEFTM